MLTLQPTRHVKSLGLLSNNMCIISQNICPTQYSAKSKLPTHILGKLPLSLSKLLTKEFRVQNSKCPTLKNQLLHTSKKTRCLLKTQMYLVLFQKLSLKYKTTGDTHCSNDILGWRRERKAPTELNPVFLWQDIYLISSISSHSDRRVRTTIRPSRRRRSFRYKYIVKLSQQHGDESQGSSCSKYAFLHFVTCQTLIDKTFCTDLICTCSCKKNCKRKNEKQPVDSTGEKTYTLLVCTKHDQFPSIYHPKK